MKSKNWLWFLVAVLAICIIVPTIFGMVKCSEDKGDRGNTSTDARDTAIVLVRDTETTYTEYKGKVENGKSGQTYVFKSKADEHPSTEEVYVYDASNVLLESNKYTLKMYDNDYNEIAMTYTSPNVTLTNNSGAKWPNVYGEQDVYFAITLNEDVSFSLVLKPMLT